MPLRDQSKYDIVVEGEPKEVTEIRKKILDTFGDLEFVDEGHKYFLHGQELPSVSTIASRFEHEFNAEQQAIDYAKKHGGTPEYWIDQWRFTNLKATTVGTQVHSYSESLAWLHMGHPENITEDNKYKYIADKEWLIPTRPKEESALKFWKEFPKNTYVVLPETKVFNIGNTLKYAGTFDLLLYYKHPKDDSKSGLMVMDWKTNGSIYKDFSRMKQKMLGEPFQNLFDEPYGCYSIQISLYILALEKIGLKVLGGRLIWLMDDGSYEIVSVPFLKNELHSIDENI